MILHELCALATRERLTDNPDFPLAGVSYKIVVAPGGSIRGIVDLRQPDPNVRGKKVRLLPKPIHIPYQKARQGTKAPPNFLVDNAKYVVGLPTPDKPFTEEEGREKSGWFRDAVAACAAATDDEGVRAVLEALEGVADGRQTVSLPADCKSNEQFAFAYEPDIDRYVHDRPAVRAYWHAQRGAAVGAEGAFACVVTGAAVGVPDNFPKVKQVPGGQPAGVSLVSFNAPAFESYGLKGNENAPIARATAEAAAAALSRLVHPAFPNPHPERAGAPMPRRNVRVGSDTLVCYWAADEGADDFLNHFGSILDAVDAEEVGEMYRSVWRGRPARVRDAGAFFALTLTGAQGRLVVRDWFTSTVAEVDEHLAQHFDDLDIVRNVPQPKGRTLPDGVPLSVLLAALAPLGKRENVPAALGTSLVRAALQGTPYPYALLQRAVERTRAEAGRTEWADLERRDARAALIKAVLRRTRTLHITPAMDPTNTNPGYLCGRLMAVLERLQKEALGDLNAGVVDRYFGAASATPRVVFVRLLRNAQHHARKAEDEPAKARTARWLKRQIDEISDRFDPKHNGFPAFLPLEDQGMFILGYHQQRHALWAKRSDVAPDAADESPPAAAA